MTTDSKARTGAHSSFYCAFDSDRELGELVRCFAEDGHSIHFTPAYTDRDGDRWYQVVTTLLPKAAQGGGFPPVTELKR
ncbi:hypothetical protein MINTM019_19150 [Mycobacterium paraintracellulare]|uniref:Oxidoreductase n=1 Tax=Mycobacterium paraintracellulare TaxID=1138383 RepID=A0ABM7KBW8_9MYCO|nr:hypothetical protein MPRI_37990 [Mycobacterium paraintracellulare]BCP04459.1 hypothetical protein MINTM019_19150 [Mycobacterium paraintracellulare]